MNELELLQVPSVPQAMRYTGAQFYVRTCYESYYQQILGLLEQYDYVSVTGTPGIGNSIFYMYFFLRYREEHEDENVLCASFCNLDLRECAVFHPDDSRKRFRDIPWPEEINDHFEDERSCNLYLYDGPPCVPPVGVKMITFTSPKYNWFRSVRKDATHYKVYMPTWKLEELIIADDLLGLNIPEDVLEQRFNLFGGSARYCLSIDTELVTEGEREMKQAVKKMTSIRDLEQVLSGEYYDDNLAHRVVSYEPREDTEFATVKFVSSYVGKLIRAAVKRHNGLKKEDLMRWLVGRNWEIWNNFWQAV